MEWIVYAYFNTCIKLSLYNIDLKVWDMCDSRKIIYTLIRDKFKMKWLSNNRLFKPYFCSGGIRQQILYLISSKKMLVDPLTFWYMLCLGASKIKSTD